MKKMIRVLMAALLIATMIPIMAFADASKMEPIADKTEAVSFIAETLEAGLDLYAAEAAEIKMVSVGNGSERCRQVYELEDGCQLILEFEDGVDGLVTFIETGEVPSIQPMATNGETLWKAYGERYFTAKATVVTGVGSGTISLENHYTLSEDGIDERYGNAGASFGSGTNINGNIEVDRVYITDATARTVGSSDVDMQAEYTITYASGGTSMVQKQVILYTIIEYVDHDYDVGKIKVKHSWSKN